MVSHSDNWIRVSHQRPCPLCGKPDNCSVSRDGQMVWCGRVADGAIRQNEGGQSLHRIGDDPRSIPPVWSGHSRQPVKRKPRKDWSAISQRLFQAAGEARARLARELGVSEQALTDLRVGWDPGKRFWSFLERDGDGNIIGINARYLDGSKKRLFGGNSGLTYAENWNAADGPALLPEGGSDTAALMTTGLNAVGRPSNNAGVNLLVDLLREIPVGCDIIVLAERDQKPDGRWPGREGAISTAKQLAEALERPIGWAFPPDHAKDVRAWLGRMPSLPVERLANLFLTGLETTVVQPPATIHVAKTSGPILPVDDWRDAMLMARLRSLGNPGYYLDASTTGAGKTHVDFNTLKFAFGREGAA